MKIPKILCLPFLVALSLAAAPPAAAVDGHEGRQGGTSSGWMPVDEEFYAPIEVEACGSTVTLASGDIREVLVREKVKKDGSIVVRYRGGLTADITRASDGAFIDELDISGPLTERISADGQVLVTLGGASIISPSDPTSAAGFAAAGLPNIFYFEHGRVAIEVEPSADPAAMEPASVEVVHRPRHVVDVCDLLDEAAGM
jgi:hypothetical protein